MDDDEPAIVSGDVETIVIKPESIELLFDTEDPFWSEEDSLEDSKLDNIVKDADERDFVTTSGEVITIRTEDIVQAPFCLESYFMDNDGFRSRTHNMPAQQQQQQNIIKVDRVTCYQCNIVFCNEHRLLEHLMTHINVYKMGCNICDKDLNLEEKFQLHTMAVTWQSVYYCDFCRKSCAGVVRSKSHPPPASKTYMCHDCECQTKQEALMQNNGWLYGNVVNKPVFTPVEQPQMLFLLPILPPIPMIPSMLPPAPTEVLQDQKQKLISETKREECENISTENSTSEVQDCNVSRKNPPKKKENKKCRRPKPKVQIVNESMKQSLKMSTRSQTKEKNKITRNYKCRYCPGAFNEDFSLMTHLREKHKFHKLKYVCKHCGKEFVQQRCYENHVGFHQLSKNHMCFVCNLAFLSKCELEQHARIHVKSILNKTYCDSPKDVALDLRKKKCKSGT